jgi:hypothetical protein
VPNNKVLGIIPTVIYNNSTFNTKRQRNDNEDSNSKLDKSYYLAVTSNTYRTTPSVSSISDNEVEVLELQLTKTMDIKIKQLQESMDEKNGKTDVKIDNLYNTMRENDEKNNGYTN